MKAYSLEALSKTKWSLIVIKNNKIIYRSKKEGLRPLLFCLKNKPSFLDGAVVYDKIVGRAAACLMIYGNVKEAMTPIISRSALSVFKKYHIETKYHKITGKIMNKSGTDICPMEKLSHGKSPQEFSRILLQ